MPSWWKAGNIRKGELFMGDGFGFVGGLIGLVLVVCFFLALIGTAIYAFFIGLIFYGCSYLFAYLAWNYKTSREKYLMFFIYLALGIAVCVGIVYFIFDTESIGAIDIILYVVFITGKIDLIQFGFYCFI